MSCETHGPLAGLKGAARTEHPEPSMKSILAALILALIVPVSIHRACAQAVTPPQPLDRIVAVVDEDVVLQSELDRDITRVTAQFAQNPQQLPPRNVLEKQILDRLVLQKLQVARADSTGVKVSDSEVDQALANIAKQNKMEVGQLRGAIAQQGLDFEQFRKGVREQLIVTRLRQRVASCTNHWGERPCRRALSSARPAASMPSTATMPKIATGMRTTASPSTRWISRPAWPRHTCWVASVRAA
jgi:hypothetical protein